MRRSLVPLITVMAALCMACPAPRPATPGDMLAASADADTISMVEAAGDRAMVVVVLHPARWKAAVNTLAPLLSGLDPKLDRIVEAVDLRQALSIMIGDDSPRKEDLAGWDATRPIVAGLFEPQSNQTMQATRAMIPSEDLILRAGVPGVRHRVLIPASDPQALAASLAGLMQRIGLQPIGTSRSGDAKIFEMQGSRGFVAILPSADNPRPGSGALVRIEIMTGELIRYPDDRARLAAWMDMIEKAPPGFQAPVTPALLAAVSRPDLLVIHLRPWLMPDLASQLGTGMVVSAIGYADPSMKSMLLARGLSEVALSRLLMSPIGVEMDDITLALDVAGGLRLAWIASLTRQGLAVIEAGSSAAVDPPKPAPGHRFATLWSRFDADAATRAAVVPQGLSEINKLDELAESINECGYFCPLHFLARAPFGLTRKLMSLAPEKMPRQLPRSLTLVVDDISPDLVSRMAVAAVMPATADTRALRGLLAETFQNAKLFIDPYGKNQLFSLGLGCDPHDLFSKTAMRSGPGVLGGMRVDLGPLANGIAPASPVAAALLDRIGPLRGRAVLSGRALGGEILVDIKGLAPLLFGTLDGNCPAWESPGAAAAGRRGARCMRKVTGSMIKGFAALSCVDPRQRSIILAHMADEVDPSLRCALAEADTREVAATTQTALTLWVAELLENEMRERDEIALLDRVCKQGRQEVCKKLAAVRAQAPVRLPEIASECACLPVSGRPIIRIAAGQENGAGSKPGRECPVLAVDVGVPFSRLMQVAGESAEGCREAVILVRRTGSLEGLSVLPQRRPGQKPAKTDTPLSLEHFGDPYVIGSNPIVIKQHGSRLDLLCAGQSMSFEATRDCPAETSCMNIKDLHAKLADIFKQSGRVDTIYFEADPDNTIEQLAPTLAAAACEPCKGDYPGRQARVVLGPVPKDVMEAASKSPLTITPGKSEVLGSLSMSVVRRVVRKNTNAVKYCYEKELIKNPSLSGKVVVNFIIAADGRVQQARIESSTIGSKQVEKCIIYAVRRFKFPKPKGGGVVNVNYPFIFKSN
ncbi:MAG TPA: AgmX/PglI C-terminal domain-containing protein [Myxococcota bacterium]|nr:AgmX/PglI C-terminal domain-containing protein [Myxococcota bacterium]